MGLELTYESALRHYKALLRWLKRLQALSYDLRYIPYSYESYQKKLVEKTFELLREDDELNSEKLKEKLETEAAKQKEIGDVPLRTRFTWGSGKSHKEIAKRINEVHSKVKSILEEFQGKIVLDVGGISVNESSEILRLGKNNLSKGSLAFGVWKGRVLWYDEIVKVPFWVLRKTEAKRLNKIASELIPWANNVTLHDFTVMRGQEENKKVLVTAPIVMRLHPGTDVGGLRVSLATWPELSECCSRVQEAVHILRRCVALGVDAGKLPAESKLHIKPVKEQPRANDSYCKICSKEEFDRFRSVYERFTRFIQNPDNLSGEEFEQLGDDIEDFWPTMTDMAEKVRIDLKGKLDTVIDILQQPKIAHPDTYVAEWAAVGPEAVQLRDAAIKQEHYEYEEKRKLREKAIQDLDRVMLCLLKDIQPVHEDSLIQGDYVFRKSGPNKWVVKYEDEVCFFDDLKGVRYIAQLLAQKNKQIPAIELCQAANGTSVDNPKPSECSNEVLDKEYLKECQETLKELRIALEQAKRNKDLAEEDRIQTKISDIENELSSKTGLGGRFRTFSNDSAKARSAVTQAIGRAVKTVDKDKYPKLRQHFKNSIHTGTVCSYKPERETTWQL